MARHIIDLSRIPFVDNHAHALLRKQPVTPAEFRGHFSEAHSPLLGSAHVDRAVHFRWALRQLGALLDVAPAEEAILGRREEMGVEAYARHLVDAAGTSHLLLDEGFPSPDTGFSSREMAHMLQVPVGRMLRIETLLERLILQHVTWDAVVDGFDARLADAHKAGYVALKSIAAYRTGLGVERVPEGIARQAHGPVSDAAKREGKLRLASKPLIDFFVWRAAGFAAAHGLPLQFHTGYGDPDLDLRLVNPLHLRPLFEDPAIASAPIVLLHASYPYTAEAAYLCAVYPNAYLDIAFSLPPLDRFELVRVLHIALGAAPAGKLMCSSDGAGIPEHYFLGATRARLCVGQVLEELVEGEEIGEGEAYEMGEMMLSGTATRLYRLTA